MRSLYLCLGAACLVLFSQGAAAPAEAPYDLVIRNGRIVDGSGNPWFRGDLAVRDGHIVAVGRVPPGSAKREIDAQGLVVAPGFIDMHSHSDLLLLEDGDAQSKIRQGVTTEVFGEGRSAGPYLGKLAPRRATVGGKAIHWTTLGGYFDTLEHAGIAPNVASYVGLDNVWQSVMGNSFERPTPAQFDEMKTLVEDAMKDGAFGLSSMLAMPPGSLATTDGIAELCKVVARHGGIYSSHIRNEATGVLDAVREAIATRNLVPDLRGDYPVCIGSVPYKKATPHAHATCPGPGADTTPDVPASFRRHAGRPRPGLRAARQVG